MSTDALPQQNTKQTSLPEMGIKWSQGYGAIRHKNKTIKRICSLYEDLNKHSAIKQEDFFDYLIAADKLSNVGLWLTVHMTYAKNVSLNGRALDASDFKEKPEGHTGGALNIVPAYIGYLLANILSGKTRAWNMGQGHCVAAIDAVNVLLRNVEAEQAQRYPINEQGLSQLCRDFYAYTITGSSPPIPLGSHVNPYTAGGISEGGYLGFASLQYPHMPLPGQSLVTFLSDGAFEEQRGSDWSALWWRGEDTGMSIPLMIANGRRIDQRCFIEQMGGIAWFKEHLNLYHFLPIVIDGHDPAAFAWAILHAETILSKSYADIQAAKASYPIHLPYIIAKANKGAGFPGENTNAAHNLPLGENPFSSKKARLLFNKGCKKLYLSPEFFMPAATLFQCHRAQQRPQEKDHCLRKFSVEFPQQAPIPDLSMSARSPMADVDSWFVKLIKQNPDLRVRVGNPDEISSNRMSKTLALLKHRSAFPENPSAEAINGSVITALNEEAVVSAAFANKQGLNLAVSYEAFAIKMLGAMRQEVIFSRHLKEAGKSPHWLSVPILLTSHTWENGKNEQSHQDPSLCEIMMGEMADVAPVYFPIDSSTGIATLATVYKSHNKVASIVIPKREILNKLTAEQAATALEQGAFVLKTQAKADIQLIAIGAYQLDEVIKAEMYLAEKGIKCGIVAIIEPGRFRYSRDTYEQKVTHSEHSIKRIIPEIGKRIFVSHTRADVLTGVLRRLDTGSSSLFMGYRNQGGTLDVLGMLYKNQQTWAHIVANAAKLLNRSEDDILDKALRAAINGKGNIREILEAY